MTRPRVRWSVVRIPEGTKVSLFSKIIRMSFLFSVYRGSFPGVKWGAKLTIRLHLEPKLRNWGAIPQYSPYDSMHWTGTIFIQNTHTEYCSVTFPRYPHWNNLLFSFRFYSSVSLGQYPHKSLPTQNIVYVRFSTSQRVTFYGVEGSSPHCCSRFLTSDSPRY